MSSKHMWGGPYPEHLWFDGEIVPWDQATIHVVHGHLFAHSIFEGIRAYWNAEQGRLYIFRLDTHIQRLFRSIKLMRMTTSFTIDQVAQACVEVVRVNGYQEDTYISPTAYFDPMVSMRKMLGPIHMFISTFPYPSSLDRQNGSEACVSSWTRINDNIMPARIKCWANYRNSAIAWTDATLSGYNQAIILNIQGKVCEAPGACMMMIQNGVLITPPVTSDILESVTRATLLQIGREVLGLEVVERDIDRTELYTAEEIFLCGTGAEVSPITAIDHYNIGDGEIGGITQQFRQAYHDIIRGIDTRYEAWRTAVL